jgi:ankyrin repeat protein
VKILLRSGEFDVRVKTNGGYTALYYAVMYTNNPELIHLLLEAPHGMECLNARDNDGWTPLIMAARNIPYHVVLPKEDELVQDCLCT